MARGSGRKGQARIFSQPANKLRKENPYHQMERFKQASKLACKDFLVHGVGLNYTREVLIKLVIKRLVEIWPDFLEQATRSVNQDLTPRGS